MRRSGEIMDLWNKVKDKLSKTLDEVETRSGELKDSIHFELEISKLKNQLEELHSERGKAYSEIGEDLYNLISSGLSYKQAAEKLSGKISFIDGVKAKIESLEAAINEAYQSNHNNSRAEHSVDVPNQSGEKD